LFFELHTAVAAMICVNWHSLFLFTSTTGGRL
jgi:hypothetical protein